MLASPWQNEKSNVEGNRGKFSKELIRIPFAFGRCTKKKGTREGNAGVRRKEGRGTF